MVLTSSSRFETSVPLGGFKIRKDTLIPAWDNDDLERIRPFEDSPCLHRIIANMPTDAESILGMANKFGLLIAAPEPLDLWRQEIRALRKLTLPKLAEKLAAARFQLVPVGDNGAVAVRYHATRFLDAIYQRFAEEFAGLIACTKCPAPNCGRWFLKSDGRGDRRFCSGLAGCGCGGVDALPGFVLEETRNYYLLFHLFGVVLFGYFVPTDFEKTCSYTGAA